MQRGQVTLHLLIALVLVLVAGALSATLSPQPNSQFKDAAAALLVVTSVAVGIERALEMLWTVVGLLAGAAWPLNLVGRQINTAVSSLDSSVTPVYETAKKVVAKLQQIEKLTPLQLSAAKEELERFKGITSGLANAAADKQQLHLLAATATQHINYIQAKYTAALIAAGAANDDPLVVKTRQEAEQQARNAGKTGDEVTVAGDQAVEDLRRNLNAPVAEIGDLVRIAGSSIGGITDFIATFKDNPGRRLMSIYLGAFAGIVIAGVLGLDLFQAILGSTSGTTTPTFNVLFLSFHGPFLGVALTGLVMGLGSNPTHEVIKAIQEYKKTQKTANVPDAVTTDALVTADGGQAAFDFRGLSLAAAPRVVAQVHAAGAMRLPVIRMR